MALEPGRQFLRHRVVDHVTRQWTEPESLELAGRVDPGTDWDYSNTNYYLLGERAMGASVGTVTDSTSHDPILITDWVRDF